MRIRAGRAPGLVIRDADLSRGPGYVCALDKEAEIRVWIVEFQVRPPSNPWGNGYISRRHLSSCVSPRPFEIIAPTISSKSAAFLTLFPTLVRMLEILEFWIKSDWLGEKNVRLLFRFSNFTFRIFSIDCYINIHGSQAKLLDRYMGERSLKLDVRGGDPSFFPPVVVPRFQFQILLGNFSTIVRGAGAMSNSWSVCFLFSFFLLFLVFLALRA